MSPQVAIVSGDIVLDCHLYGGVKTAATSFHEPGTVFCEVPGGAELSRHLLEAVAELGPTRQLYKVQSGLACGDLKTTLPQHLRSFGVWTPHAQKKGAKGATDMVWRLQRHFGYGPAESDKGTPVCIRRDDLPPIPSLILLDDGGMVFRQRTSQQAWPPFKIDPSPWIMLKMSAPLCRGDLWPTLLADKNVRERLLVVVSAEDLRREDVQIRKHLSWEQTAADMVTALHKTPVGQQLLQAANLIVNFRSAGALWLRRGQGEADHTATLIFDPLRLEGDFSQAFEGTVYGFQSCLAVSIAHHVLLHEASGSVPGKDGLLNAVTTGIANGLLARRKLLEQGHGKVGGGSPGFPSNEIAQVITGECSGFGIATVPPLSELGASCPWTILTSKEMREPSTPPLIGLAQLTARFGRSALSDVPCLSMGDLFTVDRSEIESLRTLEGLIRDYEHGGAQKKPLSIGVFGPPGAGKSFGVKALAKAILGEKVPFLEFNLAQFKDTSDLIGAFHRVRDEVLKGATPVAFWDEFDSRNYHWLQYLLAPMQDGAFQEGQVTHSIGKCVFIFAGGTADTLDAFGIQEPGTLKPEERGKLGGTVREDRIAEEEAWRQFKLLKGPDFVSRLHGHFNVLGPNPRAQGTPPCDDRTFPIRRALMLRGVLGLKDDSKKCDELDMDAGLLYALLSVPRFRHGSRSLEKILLTLAKDSHGEHYHRSALPPDPLLDRETDAKEFHRIMNQRNEFKTHPNIEELAAAIHENYRHNAAEKKWAVTTEINKPYSELPLDAQASNCAAARRIPDLLSLIDYKIDPNENPNDESWTGSLRERIAGLRERLAQGEHLGWMAERRANGWNFAKVRNDDLKLHNLLVDWRDLSETDKNKDRENMDAIPKILKLARYKAVPVSQDITS